MKDVLLRALQKQREMAAVDDETGWAVARRRSVILSGKKDGKRFVREDFTDSLNEILTCLKDHVVAFGPLARNSEWCLTLKTDAAKDIVLCAGTLSVRGCIFYVRSADKMQFSARVLWAPSYIPNAAIVNVLEKTCEVQSIVSEKSTAKGFEGIPTGNRRLVLTGLKDDIPHTFNIINPHTKEKFEILVLIPGRSPLCFRCKETGHFRSECFTPQCRACGVFGHTYESCAVANSYSSKLRGPANPRTAVRPRRRLTTIPSTPIETVELSRWPREAPGRDLWLVARARVTQIRLRLLPLAGLGTLRRALAAALGLGRR